MSTIRENLDTIEFNNLSEDDQRELAHMVLNNMHQDLEEWCQLRELDMGKIKKWLKTGALAAALAGAGMTAAHAQSYQKGGNFNSSQMQQPQGGSNQDELWRKRQQQGNGGYSAQDLQHSKDQKRMDAELQQQRGQGRQQQRGQGRQQQHWDQGRDQRGDQRGQAWGGQPDAEQYQHWQQDHDDARRWARQRGGWQERPRWHLNNPWAMINIEPPSEVLYFRDNGQDIMFIPHPRRMDLMRAREMGGMITRLMVPQWPEPISAFVYEMDGVTYITALPGQLP